MLWSGHKILWSRRSHQFARTPDGDPWAWFREKCLEWIQIPSWGNSRDCFLLTMFSVFSINHLSVRGPCNLCTKVFFVCGKKRISGEKWTDLFHKALVFKSLLDRTANDFHLPRWGEQECLMVLCHRSWDDSCHSQNIIIAIISPELSLCMKINKFQAGSLFLD